MTSTTNQLTVLYLVSMCQLTEAQELLPDKICPVIFPAANDISSKASELGLLVISKAWFHNSGQLAGYIAKDDATGIGVEIHFLPTAMGKLAVTTLHSAILIACCKYALQISNAYAVSTRYKSMSPIILIYHSMIIGC